MFIGIVMILTATFVCALRGRLAFWYEKHRSGPLTLVRRISGIVLSV
jgi:hypothetical protein